MINYDGLFQAISLQIDIWLIINLGEKIQNYCLLDYFLHETADLSIIVHPVFHPVAGNPTVNPVGNIDASLANKAFFDKELGILDPYSFYWIPITK
jgi:hypothetical protein